MAIKFILVLVLALAFLTGCAPKKVKAHAPLPVAAPVTQPDCTLEMNCYMIQEYI